MMLELLAAVVLIALVNTLFMVAAVLLSDVWDRLRAWTKIVVFLAPIVAIVWLLLYLS